MTTLRFSGIQIIAILKHAESGSILLANARFGYVGCQPVYALNVEPQTMASQTLINVILPLYYVSDHSLSLTMLDALYKTYRACRDQSLGALVHANQIPPAEKEQRYWEKTIEALYASTNRGRLQYAAPLAHHQEDYGDLLVAYNNMQWALIEFKQDISGRGKERAKYVRTYQEKYVGDTSRPAVMAEHEKTMFEAFVTHIGDGELVELNGKQVVKREPHFFIYGPAASQSLTEFNQLRGSLYWGAWATKFQEEWTKIQLKDIEVEPDCIPNLSASYEEFIQYAGCIKLAKSGVFSVSERDDGSAGGLADMSLVVGLMGREVTHVCTLHNFLLAQKLIAEHRPDLTPQPPFQQGTKRGW